MVDLYGDLEMIKEEKLSWCEVHGKQHALSSGLCCNIDCVKKIIWHHASSWKVIKAKWLYINQLNCGDDFAVWVVHELLREEKEQGKKPTLNPHWLRFRILKYASTKIRYSDLPNQSVPKMSVKQIDKNTTYIESTKANHRSILEEMINEGAMGNNAIVDVEELMSQRELKEAIKAKFGETVLLRLTDEITKKEYTRLLGAGVSGASDLYKLAQRHLQHFYLEGEWLLTVDMDLKAWRLSYNVKHYI